MLNSLNTNLIRSESHLLAQYNSSKQALQTHKLVSQIVLTKKQFATWWKKASLSNLFFFFWIDKEKKSNINTPSLSNLFVTLARVIALFFSWRSTLLFLETIFSYPKTILHVYITIFLCLSLTVKNEKMHKNANSNFSTIPTHLWAGKLLIILFVLYLIDLEIIARRSSLVQLVGLTRTRERIKELEPRFH